MDTGKINPKEVYDNQNTSQKESREVFNGKPGSENGYEMDTGNAGNQPAVIVDADMISFPSILVPSEGKEVPYSLDWEKLSAIDPFTADDGTTWLSMDAEIGIRVLVPMEHVCIKGCLDELREQCSGRTVQQFSVLLKRGVNRIYSGKGKEAFTEWSGLLHSAAEFVSVLSREKRLQIDTQGLMACCIDLGNTVGSFLRDLTVPFIIDIDVKEVLANPVNYDLIQYGIPLVRFTDSVLKPLVTAETVPVKAVRSNIRNNMKKRASHIEEIVPHLPPDFQGKAMA